METAEVLAIVGGHVEEEVLLRNEYLAVENEIPESKPGNPLRFTHAERVRLAKIGKRLGRKALADVGCIVKPDTLLKWFRELVAKKFDGSKNRRSPGRPRVDPEIEKLDIPFSPFLDEHLIEVTAYNGCGNATTTQSCTVQLTESYQRGDVTGNGQFGLEDPIYFLYWVYLDYPDVSCFDAADADDDGALSLTDPVYMLLNLFGQGPPLLPPSSDCGLDPTPDGIDCEAALLCP